MNKFMHNEIKNNTIERVDTFSKEGTSSFAKTKEYIESLFENLDDGYFSNLAERINFTPTDGENGRWEGKRGESKFIPSQDTEKGQRGAAKLAEYGMEGLPYKNGEPDYSKCSEGTVKIDHMTSNRADNYSQADKKLAEQWNEKNKDGKNDWKTGDVKKYREDNELSWHECCDCKTMHLVSRDIHGAETSVFLHSGGVFECKIRDNVGGGFDEED